ncbi:MAG: YbaB/EbfC family nucleoid-associated protein [Paracoccaceae bacterium]|nr:YbaB/EbfC family nucleoid-associated protein [Paracoccaceae bacterium]MDE2911922.1 YbaB/EbfC family nucleoid-associated protein [Paracoccaceae bacterium]
MTNEFFGFGNIPGLVEKAEAFKSKVEEVKGSLDTMTITGESGAGLVKARVNGHGRLMDLDIHPSLFSAEDREVVEDLIVAAVRSAVDKAEETAKSTLAQTLGVPDLPAGMKLPF